MSAWEKTLKKLKRRGYLESERVEEALREIERREFVPQKYESSAYSDRPLPIGHEQTISAPHMVALMTDILDPSKRDKVLEIGTGSGYQAAVLSRLVKEVHTIERIEELYRSASKNLEDFENVQVYHRDGSEGLEEEAPFGKIIVTAAAPEIPESLKEQLAEGGRLVVPVEEGRTQALKVLERRDGEVKEVESKSGVRFVPLKEDKN